MVELMIAVLILSICASAIIRAITQTGKRSSMSAEKALILAEAQNWMEGVRAKGKARTLVAGTSNVSIAITGVPFQVTRSTTIALSPGYTDLYDVSVRMSWNPNLGREMSGELVLESKVVSPDD